MVVVVVKSSRIVDYYVDELKWLKFVLNEGGLTKVENALFLYF